MRRLIAVLAALYLAAAFAYAQALSESDKTEFQSIISSQIDAFRTGDGARAYSYASPTIRTIFPTPESFMNMVRQGYPPVYRAQSFAFGQAGFSASGRPIQRVTVVGPDGQSYQAIYTMERQPDGKWQINGCALVQAPGLDA